LHIIQTSLTVIAKKNFIIALTIQGKPMLLNYAKFTLTFIAMISLPLSFASGSEVSIPERSDWSTPKEIVGLRLGPKGSWDDSSPGAITPCTIVKLSEIYYLYYVGSDGRRDHDNGPAHRKLGLATSSNGIDFTKYDGNPILSWSPRNNDEEGIFGAKALSIDGRIYLFINTMSAKNATTDQVWADVYLVTSTDGKHFSKPILVLDHSISYVVGYGDELGPTGVMNKDGKWSLYYFAKGLQVSHWKLCLATGESSISFGRTKLLIDERKFFGSGGDVNWLSSSKIAMFYQKRSDWDRIEIYTASADSPYKLTKTKTWDGFANKGGVIVFLDKSVGKWFMYNRDQSEGNKTFVRIALMKYEKGSRSITH